MIMPSVSAKQRRFMAAVAHNPKFAAAAGVPQSVGQDFHAADKKVGYNKKLPTTKKKAKK
jgi:hypothetical protein